MGTLIPSVVSFVLAAVFTFLMFRLRKKDGSLSIHPIIIFIVAVTLSFCLTMLLGLLFF